MEEEQEGWRAVGLMMRWWEGVGAGSLSSSSRQWAVSLSGKVKVGPEHVLYPTCLIYLTFRSILLLLVIITQFEDTWPYRPNTMQRDNALVR